MRHASNGWTTGEQGSGDARAEGPIQRLARNPGRMVWQDRLLALHAELAALDRAIRESERTGAPAGSFLVTSREKALSRMADLRWLIERCG